MFATYQRLLGRLVMQAGVLVQSSVFDEVEDSGRVLSIEKSGSKRQTEVK